MPNRAALANFGNKVSRLPWSSRRSKLVVKRIVAAADAIYGMQISDLCADTRALVASNGQTTPAGTTRARCDREREQGRQRRLGGNAEAA